MSSSGAVGDGLPTWAAAYRAEWLVILPCSCFSAVFENDVPPCEYTTYGLRPNEVPAAFVPADGPLRPQCAGPPGEYLQVENQMLRSRLPKRVLFTPEERCRLPRCRLTTPVDRIRRRIYRSLLKLTESAQQSKGIAISITGGNLVKCFARNTPADCCVMTTARRRDEIHVRNQTTLLITNVS